DASALNATTSGVVGVGVTLAFNSIGWAPQNILFNTVDAIIGDPAISDGFGGEVPSGAGAYVHDSEVDASGAVAVSATAGAHLNATVSNDTSVSAGGLTSASGSSIGVVIGQNKVSSAAEAYIDYADSYAGARSVHGGNGVSVGAIDSASITADITVVASAVA